VYFLFVIHEQWISANVGGDKKIVKLCNVVSDVNRYCFWLYYLIFMTLHWPFFINVRQCSLSIKRYVYSCRTWQPGLLNALFTELMCGTVAQWLRFWAVNQETMGSNPAETIFIFYVFLLLTCLLTKKNVEYFGFFQMCC